MRPTRRMVPFVAGGVALLLVIALVGVVLTRGGSTRTVQAKFATAPGLFKGNHVDVLGVTVGSIVSIHPADGYAMVTMKVKSNVKLPANVGAVIMAPEVVADRFVQLTPPYGGGSTWDTNQPIPTNRTAVPESVDSVIGTLTTLAGQLGPNGANSNGALTSLLANFANQLKGNGGDIKTAVANFSQALHSIAADSPQLKDLLNNLGSLSQALANNSDTYQAFTKNLASVSTYLANDRSNIASALSNLQQFFASLNTFVIQNQGTLHTSLTNLDQFAQALTYQQDQLAKVFDLTPLALQNLNRAIDLNAPGGPAIRARYDPVPNSSGLFNNVCGNSTLRFLVVLAAGTQTNPLTAGKRLDTVCAVGNAINALMPPPGSTAGPNLSLSALAAGR
ncbi:MAG: MCE family protein [Actinomycetota bacterium]|nr:MCE family protein [Actinomycetota bacterium]